MTTLKFTSALAKQIVAALRTEEARNAKTFGDLAEAWLKRIRRVNPGAERRHVELLADLHQLREGELTKADIDTCLMKNDREHGGTLGAATLNKLRGTGKLIISDAQANREWAGLNPFDFVQPRRIARPPYVLLTLEEIVRTLAQIRPVRARMARVAFFTGVRKGELLALEKSDVDFARGFLTISKSHSRSSTKTGRSRLVPISDAIVSDLRAAIADSPNALVFPGTLGELQRADTKLARVWKAAQIDAGVVKTWKYRCNKKGCGHQSNSDDRVERRCPTCGRRLLTFGVAKSSRWYDLRHLSASQHLAAGASSAAVKQALGWAARDAGDDFYVHLSDASFRLEFNKLKLPSLTDALAPAAGTLPEPAAPAVPDEVPTLLTVSDVAGRLGISPRSVYARYAAGDLPFVRVGGSIRFEPAVVNRFVQTSGGRTLRSRGARTPSAEEPKPPGQGAREEGRRTPDVASAGGRRTQCPPPRASQTRSEGSDRSRRASTRPNATGRVDFAGWSGNRSGC